MANETTIDKETARRLLLILSLEGDVKRGEIEWALAIIHQIPGYGGMTLAKAVQDRPLKEILVAIAAEQISPTTPKDLKALIEGAEERKAALKTAEEVGEKRAEEFIEAAEKAAKTKAEIKVPETAPPSPPSEEPVSFGIKITPAALKAFGESAGKSAGTPLKLVSFFSPPKVLAQAPQTTAALGSAMSLSQISARAQGLPERERKRLLALIENLRQAEFSFYAQVKLQRTPVSVQEVTILMGSEFGRPQGEVVTLIRGGAPSGRGPSFTGRIGQQIFGGLAQRAVTKAATKVVTSALTKAGVSVTTAAAGTAVAPGVGTVVGLVAGWLVDKAKDLLSWMTRNAPKVAIGIGAFLFGTGFVLQSSLLMGGGALVGAGGLVGQAGGVGPALSQAGGFASSVITGITSLAVASIATPLIVALISIPVLVAIILFIINSGAYIVPPSASQFAESPYIDIEKTPEPPGPFNNPPPSVSVNYTISIKAKKGTLTNVHFQYECRVVGSSQTPCPEVQIPEPPQQISPTEVFSFSYGAIYDSSFKDVIVVDTFTIIADAPDQKAATAATSASVVIGNPPIDCPLPAYDTKGKRWASYTPGDESRGHASNAYWVGKEPCYVGFPQSISCEASTDPRASNNRCTIMNKQPRCAQYGFAYDVWPVGGVQVFAPRVGKESLVWNCSYGFSNGTAGHTYWCDSGPYHLVLTHLKEGARTGSVPSGQVIGELHPQQGNAHVHIEFSLNGVYQRPEDFFCF